MQHFPGSYILLLATTWGFKAMMSQKVWRGQD